jgi:hypothetical protein
METTIFRRLQRHLDKQAVGFPAAWSGADIRLLKRLFTPDEARVALDLSYKPMPTTQILGRADASFPAEQTKRLLESMLAKGAIGWKEKGGTDHWYVIPLVVGMYEQQDGAPSPELERDARAYFKTLSYSAAFLPSSRTDADDPVNQSIPVEHPVATYDQIRGVVDAPGLCRFRALPQEQDVRANP